MDVLLFLLLTITFVLIYIGKRKPAIVTFGVTMLIYIYWFSYHADDKLNINL